MTYFVYAIISEEGHHYVGQTSDLFRRLFEHNNQLSHSTKHGRNWQIFLREEYSSRADAMKREKWLKSGIGRKWLCDNIPEWSPPKAE